MINYMKYYMYAVYLKILNSNFTTNSSLLNSIPDYHLTFLTSFLHLHNYSHYTITTSIIVNIHIIISINMIVLQNNRYMTIHIYPYRCISPDNVCINAPLCAFQIFMVLSLDPDTTLLPSAEKATEFTQSAWPNKRYMSNKTNISSTCAN